MYKNIRTVVVGSINADMLFHTLRVPECGENLLGTHYSSANGGKGANQAVALARLGAQTKMIGKVADDENGRRLIENLKKNKVDTSGVYSDGTQTGLAAIIIDGEGRNRIIVYEGANSELTSEDAVNKIDSNTDILLIQFEIPQQTVIDSVKKAVDNKIMSVIDCGPAKAFELEKMQGATIITPNESETYALTGIYPENKENILKASEILKSRSLAQFVVLKLGGNGCSVFDGNKLTMLSPYPAKVLDTTAAGDSFTAAMALEFYRTGDILKACDMGNKAGSIAVSRVGAEGSMPTAEELLCI